jgi:hypothetical protein
MTEDYDGARADVDESGSGFFIPCGLWPVSVCSFRVGAL